MKTLWAMMDYLKKYNKEEIIDILYQNNLIYILGKAIGVEECYYNNELAGVAKIHFFYHKKILMQICSLFNANNVLYIVFKGVILSHLLYGSVARRAAGDIDVYVEQSHFGNALMLLRNLGFGFRDEEGLDNEHHVVLTNGTVVVELHKNMFNPQINIDESYFRCNTVSQTILGYPITTFNETATLLHLLYHLYMDIFLGEQLWDAVYFRDVILNKRFLFRAYEIALYSERYYDSINWKDVETDIQKQKLSPCFRSMIHSLLEIFPETFPEFLLRSMDLLEYKIMPINIHQVFCVYLEENKDKEYADLMGEFVRLNWKGPTTVTLNKNASFEVPYHRSFKKSVKINDLNLQKDLKCVCTLASIEEGIEICFNVSQEDICLSEEEQLDEMETDGIHLLLCSTNKYCYRSIFLFPKIVSSGQKVIAVDKNCDERIENIDGKFDVTQEGYRIRVLLNKDFIDVNYLEREFYIGVLVSKCCPNTKERIRELLLMPDNRDWYNPTKFVKVIC